MTLLEFLLKLIGNDEESLELQENFREDPYGTLKDAGLEDLTAEDVHDALVLIQDNDTASFDRNYDTGSNHLVAAAAAPRHSEGDAEGGKGAVEYINKYVTNNYVDDRDTIVDNSVNQKIDTDGGDFRQDIDIDAVTASGDGAVAAGGDIEDSTVTTGNGNIVGGQQRQQHQRLGQHERGPVDQRLVQRRERQQRRRLVQRRPGLRQQRERLGQQLDRQQHERLGQLLGRDRRHDAALLIQDNDDSDFDRKYDTGGNHHHTPPPPPPHKEPHESDHEAAVKYLNTYVTNNWVDDRDTIVDNSINQVIDTDGGDFRQNIDIDAVTASGDGAVAAGGDIDDSTITTGDDNIVGDGNQVVDGDGNTTAFGNGSATSTNVGGDLTVDDGSAFATGGNAGVDNSDHSVNDSFNETIDASINDSGNDYSDNSVSDSGNLDVDVDASTNDSFNQTTDDSVNDSGNVDVSVDDVSVEDSIVTA